jgi:hypothetical protein
MTNPILRDNLQPLRNQLPDPVGANEKPSAPDLTVVMPR